jgi:DNA-binding CsgD family transcriptional regulator
VAKQPFIDCPRPTLGSIAFRDIERRLRRTETPAELLAKVAPEACRSCGFDRGVVVGVSGGWLTATACGTLDDPASDTLRRQVLAAPVPLHPRSAEFELIRRVEGGLPGRPNGRSVLAQRLSLDVYAMTAVVLDLKVLTLLVVDRPIGQVTATQQADLDMVGHLAGCALERLMLRSRIDELASEIRHLAVSAQAVAHEALSSPPELPGNEALGLVYTNAGMTQVGASGLHALLTPRELEIAAYLVAGRSNREIAELLYLAPDTVKGCVARLLRKLGAANRVEAVSRYLQLTQTGVPTG